MWFRSVGCRIEFKSISDRSITRTRVLDNIHDTHVVVSAQWHEVDIDLYE